MRAITLRLGRSFFMQGAYPVIFTKSPDFGYTAMIKGLPGATNADTLEECRELAKDLLVTTLGFYAQRRRKVPAPEECGDIDDCRLVNLPLIATMKFALHNRMLELDMHCHDLAELIGVSEAAARKICHIRCRCQIDNLQRALHKLGLKTTLEIKDIGEDERTRTSSFH